MLVEDLGRTFVTREIRALLVSWREFGAWEMNWIGFNTAGDTRLAPETNKALGHFMYPYAETAGRWTTTTHRTSSIA